MAEDKKPRKHGPKRATDRRRTYAATIGGVQINQSGDGDGNGTAKAMGLFNDRRKKLGSGKRAA